VSIHR